MWTFSNLVAIGLFLFGSTFLWMTPAMAGTTPPPTGTAWMLTNLLSFAAVIGFTVAAWAVYKQYAWWDTAALVSGIVGLVAVVPFAVSPAWFYAVHKLIGLRPTAVLRQLVGPAVASGLMVGAVVATKQVVVDVGLVWQVVVLVTTGAATYVLALWVLDRRSAGEGLELGRLAIPGVGGRGPAVGLAAARGRGREPARGGCAGRRDSRSWSRSAGPPPSRAVCCRRAAAATRARTANPPATSVRPSLLRSGSPRRRSESGALTAGLQHAHERGRVGARGG